MGDTLARYSHVASGPSPSMPQTGWWMWCVEINGGDSHKLPTRHCLGMSQTLPCGSLADLKASAATMLPCLKLLKAMIPEASTGERSAVELSLACVGRASCILLLWRVRATATAALCSLRVLTRSTCWPRTCATSARSRRLWGARVSSASVPAAWLQHLAS